MQLFTLLNILFSSPIKWKTLTNGDKKKNHFMVNRMMSINFPLQAQALNHLKIDPVSTVDFWQKFVEKIYTKTPYWMYTKGSKKKKEEKEIKLNIKESTIREYARRHSLDLKSVKDSLKFFPEESIKELKRFEKIIQ